MQLNMEPNKLYGNPEKAPVANAYTILLSIPTISASLNPITTSVVNITIFDSPNFAPGAIKGNGINDSIMLNASPKETKMDIKTILFVPFIKTTLS